MINREAIIEQIIVSKPPMAQAEGVVNIVFKGLIPKTWGPLYKVATNAPIIATKVPIVLAIVLKLLYSKVSILILKKNKKLVKTKVEYIFRYNFDTSFPF